MNLDEKIKTIAKHYGLYIQAAKLAEECAEYSAVFLKVDYLWRLKQNAPEYSAKVEYIEGQISDALAKKYAELSDVLLVARQIEYIMTQDQILKSEIERNMEAKADRQLKRIEEEPND